MAKSYNDIAAFGPYLYFAEAEVSDFATGGKRALMVPASAYLGANPISATELDLFFKDVAGDDAVSVITLTVATNTHKAVMKAMIEIVNGNKRGGVIVVADEEDTTAKEMTTNHATSGAGTSYDPAVYGTKTAVYHKAFDNNVEGCDIDA